MLNNLLGLLLRFSEEKVAIMCDLTKMYHSIDISLKDQMTHIFLWRDLNETAQVGMYAMTALNFGDRPSGSIAIAALQMTAELSEKDFLNASKMIKDNSYMDDILNSVDSVAKTKELASSVTTVVERGGFKVKEWVTSGETRNTTPQSFPESTESSERVGDDLGPHKRQFQIPR